VLPLNARLTFLPGRHGLKTIQQTAIVTQRGGPEKEQGHHQVQLSQVLLLPPWSGVFLEVRMTDGELNMFLSTGGRHRHLFVVRHGHERGKAG
jgi:hypothetical protein